jgi:hypothetical protein
MDVSQCWHQEGEQANIDQEENQENKCTGNRTPSQVMESKASRGNRCTAYYKTKHNNGISKASLDKSASITQKEPRELAVARDASN